MSVDGERIEKSIQRLFSDLKHGSFTMRELRFFEFGFGKLIEVTSNTIKKAETNIVGEE